ncbi:MAG: hypothetical protein JWM43_628 [Acidobacteriaceae bacterium]|nr:hypothetical protein [Acidobacteriaceae bacterium]
MKIAPTSVLSCVSFLAVTGGSLSFASKIPTAALNLNDNVVTCGTNARCSNKVMFGRNYKVIQTAKFTVMLSISNEGAYTRADVSIANNGSYSQNISPEDFRVEEVVPKTKILLYVPPSELHNLPAPAPVAPVLAVVVPPAKTTAATPQVQVASLGASVPVPEAAPTSPSIDEFYAAAKREEALREAADREAAQKHLEAASIQANEVVRGRVYFQKDSKAKQVNVVLPLAGLVFQFPYSMKF